MWHLWETAAGHIYSAAIKTHGKVTEGQSLDVRLHIEIVSNIKTFNLGLIMDHKNELTRK